jgi:hypothetical protein
MARTSKPLENVGPEKRGRGKSFWLLALCGAAGLILATPTMILAAILLMPTALAWISDREPGRPTARAVLLFGLAASCWPFALLWRAGHRSDLVLMVVSDIRVLAIAWTAQAAGWLLTQILPLLIGLYAEASTHLVVGRLRSRRDTLAEEWSEPP